MRVQSVSGTVALLSACLLLAASAEASTPVERLSERGPATLSVGLMFTLGSPFAAAYGALSGGRVRIHGCRFGHGLKMLIASPFLLTAGLLVSPFNASALPDAWLDGVVEAYQEDYCTRPAGSFFP